MSNRFKGELDFEVDGGLYTLCFPIDALILLEERYDQPIGDLGQLFGDGMRMSMLKFFFWAGLQAKHDGLQQKTAGELASKLGLPAAAALIRESFLAAFAPPASEGATPGPPPAADEAGTGISS